MVYIDIDIIDAKKTIDLNQIASQFKNLSKEAGALVIYLGFVKGIVEGKKVRKLAYQIHEDYTREKLREIAEDIASKYPELKGIGIYHKKGELEPSEDVVYIITVAISRDTAFKAAKEAIDRVKHETGIWKLEIRENGNYWVLGEGKRIPSKKAQI